MTAGVFWQSSRFLASSLFCRFSSWRQWCCPMWKWLFCTSVYRDETSTLFRRFRRFASRFPGPWRVLAPVFCLSWLVLPFRVSFPCAGSPRSSQGGFVRLVGASQIGSTTVSNTAQTGEGNLELPCDFCFKFFKFFKF